MSGWFDPSRSRLFVQLVRGVRAWPASLALGLCTWAACVGCGGPPAPAEYPDVTLQVSGFRIVVDDTRKEWAKPITEPQVMTQGEDDTYPQQLPDGFEARARQHLAKVTGQSGPELTVNMQVRRADVTFYNERYRGDFVRYDVVLGFVVKTPSGAMLTKGSSGHWQELPSEQATSEEMRRVFMATAIGAFDKYFADEGTLSKIETELARYLDAHPNER